MQQTSLLDDFMSLLSDKTEEVSSSMKASWNQGLGYVSGWWDTVDVGFTHSGRVNKLVAVPTVGNIPAPHLPLPLERTPIYTLMRMYSGIDTKAQLAKDMDIKVAKSNLNTLLGQLDDITTNGGETVTGPLIQLFRDQGLLPSWVDSTYSFTPDYLYQQVNKARSSLGRTSEQISADLRQQTATVVSALNAVSPLLVAAAGLKPKYTRKLMGVHLVSDALTGVLNFRDPARDLSLTKTLAPYLTMAGIGLTHQIAGGFR
jgi:hypothetical protein